MINKFLILAMTASREEKKKKVGLESYLNNDPTVSRILRLISKAIKSGHWKLSTWISRAKLEEEQEKFIHVERAWSVDTWLRYCTLKAFHLW